MKTMVDQGASQLNVGSESQGGLVFLTLAVFNL